MRLLSFALALAAYVSIVEAEVHHGIDTLSIEDGLNFSDPDNHDIDNLDIIILQLRDSHTVDAFPPVISSRCGIVDWGLSEVSILENVPDDLEPDPESAIPPLPSGELRFFSWSLPLRERHLYVVWCPKEGIAQLYISQIINSKIIGFEQFVEHVIVEWAYQDDGSLFFGDKSVIEDVTWGDIKMSGN